MTDPQTWEEAPIEAVCIAFSRGLPPAKHRKVFGITAKTPSTSLPFDEALWSQTDDGDYENLKPIVQLDGLGDWNVSIEPNGFIASIPEVATALSAGGEAIVAFWNVNFDATFLRAVDGEVVRRFDPVAYDLDGLGDPLPEEDGLPWDDEWRGSLMVLVERLIGVAVTPQWLLEPERATYVGRMRVTKPSYRVIYGDPELDDLLADSDLDVVRAAVAHAVEHCAARLGLADDPQLRDSVALFRSSWGPTRLEEMDGAPRRSLWVDATHAITLAYSQESMASAARGERFDPNSCTWENPEWARMQLALCVDWCLGSYPEDGGKHLQHAQFAIGPDWDALRDELVAILRAG